MTPLQDQAIDDQLLLLLTCEREGLDSLGSRAWGGLRCTEADRIIHELGCGIMDFVRAFGQSDTGAFVALFI